MDHSWGLVLLVANLADARLEVERVWDYAARLNKKVYLCLVHGDASSIKADGTFYIINNSPSSCFYLALAGLYL